MHREVILVLASPGWRGRGFLANQLERASATCMTNISEGYASRTASQVTNGVSIAIASAAEVQSLLYTALDSGVIAHAQFATIYDQAAMVQKLGKAFITAGRRLLP